jgi:TatA/E family protein of Tat protein translocase
MPFGLHPAYLIILLAIVLIIFGPGKLPELGGAVGRGIKEFRKTSSDLTDEIRAAATPPEKDTTHVATDNHVTATAAPASEPEKAEPEKKS